MVGTARKKLNSAAVRRSIPIASAPMMVAPERLTPGIIATHCTSPTPSAWRAGSWPIPVAGPGRAVRSIARMANPPSTSAAQTTSGLPSSTSMYLLAASPITTEGRKARSRLRRKARLSGSSRSTPIPTAQNVRQYCTTTARIAPSWMTTLNTFQVSESKPNSSVARIRCPVEETGRNSVSPSTMPSRTAVMVSVMAAGHAGRRRRWQGAAPGIADL